MKKNVTINIIAILLSISLQSSSFAGLFVSRGFVNRSCAVPVQFQNIQSHSANFIRHSAKVFPTVNYFVGAPIRLQAVIKQELNTDPVYQEFQQFKQWKLQQQYAIQSPESSQQIAPISLVEKNCSKCHTGASPKGEFSIDGIFTAIERDKAARAVILGDMPKSVILSPAEKGDLVKEILLLGVE